MVYCRDSHRGYGDIVIIKLRRMIMNKNKAFVLIACFSFFFFVAGILIGIYLQWKNDKFWQSVIIEPDRIEQVEKLIKQNEAMVDRLIELQQALDDYWMPQSSPDIERPSREE